MFTENCFSDSKYKEGETELCFINNEIAEALFKTGRQSFFLTKIKMKNNFRFETFQMLLSMPKGCLIFLGIDWPQKPYQKIGKIKILSAKTNIKNWLLFHSNENCILKVISIFNFQ